MNVLEAGRRLRLIVAGLIVAGSGYYWLNAEDPRVQFNVTAPASGYTADPSEYASCNGQTEFYGLKQIGSTYVRVEVCFERRDDGLIPVGPNSYAAPYSDEMKLYAASMVPEIESQFPRFEEFVKERDDAKSLQRGKDAFSFMGAALALLFGVTIALGWVVKGFSAPRPAGV